MYTPTTHALSAPCAISDAPSPQAHNALSPPPAQLDLFVPGAHAPAQIPTGMAAPNSWLRLPTELKLAVFEQFKGPGYVGLALADSENYALAQHMPGWRWKQGDLRQQLEAAADHTEVADILVAHDKTVRAMRGPLELPIDSSQHLINTAHGVLFESGQFATVVFDTLEAFSSLRVIPSSVQACLDLCYQGEEVALDFLHARQPHGLDAAHLSGLRLGDYLGPGAYKLFGRSVREVLLDENNLGDAVLGLPPRLEQLSLKQNDLTAVQVERWRFPEFLRRLDLSENPLGAVPRNLPPYLKYLNLAQTGVSGASLVTVSLPRRLDMLILSGNLMSAEDYNLLCARYPSTDIIR